MAKLRWSPQAADDLEEACQYIASDSPQYARLFAQSVMRILKAMSRQKLPGSIVPNTAE
jgi:toxin ParE1/3/4